MSWIDLNDMFSNNVAVTATAISDVKQVAAKNLGLSLQTNPLVNLGAVDDLWMVILCDTTATAVGAATVTFSLESDSTADLATSATVHYVTSAIPKATLVAGYVVAAVKLPSASYEAFLGVRYTVATGPLTAGKFTAYLTSAYDVQRSYAAGSTIGI